MAYDVVATDYLEKWLINDEETVYCAAKGLAESGDLAGLEQYVLAVLDRPDEISDDAVSRYVAKLVEYPWTASDWDEDVPRTRSEGTRETRRNLSDAELANIDWADVASVLVSE